MDSEQATQASSTANGLDPSTAGAAKPDENPLDKSYESMGSQEVEEPHYNFDSDGEPPQDEVGDKLTIIHKRQVVKEILEVGQDLGKPGRPFIVTVSLEGYFAKEESAEERKIKMEELAERQKVEVRVVKPTPGQKKFAEDEEEPMPAYKRNEEGDIMLEPSRDHLEQEAASAPADADAAAQEEAEEEESKETAAPAGDGEEVKTEGQPAKEEKKK